MEKSAAVKFTGIFTYASTVPSAPDTEPATFYYRVYGEDVKSAIVIRATRTLTDTALEEVIGGVKKGDIALRDLKFVNLARSSSLIYRRNKSMTWNR